MTIHNPPLSQAAWDRYVKLKAPLCTDAALRSWIAEQQAAREKPKPKKEARAKK